MNCACGCGIDIDPFDSYGRPHKFVLGHNKSQLGRIGLQGDKNPNWKGGITINTSGYLLEKRDKKYIRQHRLIFEEYYNCCLLYYTDIHHLNGNRQDNRIENLQPLIHGKHSTVTHKGKPKHRNSQY